MVYWLGVQSRTFLPGMNFHTRRNQLLHLLMSYYSPPRWPSLQRLGDLLLESEAYKIETQKPSYT